MAPHPSFSKGSAVLSPMDWFGAAGKCAGASSRNPGPVGSSWLPAADLSLPQQSDAFSMSPLPVWYLGWLLLAAWLPAQEGPPLRVVFLVHCGREANCIWNTFKEFFEYPWFPPESRPYGLLSMLHAYGWKDMPMLWNKGYEFLTCVSWSLHSSMVLLFLCCVLAILKLVLNFLHQQYPPLDRGRICLGSRCQFTPPGPFTRLEPRQTLRSLGVKESRMGALITFSIKLLINPMKNPYFYLSYENHRLFILCFHPWSCQSPVETHWLYASHSFFRDL